MTPVLWQLIVAQVIQLQATGKQQATVAVPCYVAMSHLLAAYGM